MIPDELQAAHELDVLLSARQAGQEPPPLPNLSAEEAAFARALLRLAEELQPEARFASGLEERLIAAARRRAERSSPVGARHRREWLAHLHLRLARAGRRPRWVALAAVMMVLMVLAAATPVRAALLSVLQIGAVRIFTGEPTVSELPTPLVSSPTYATTSLPAPRPPDAILDLAGETTLVEAQRQVTFPIRLPSYPSDLGPPDHIYLQDMGGMAVILVWTDAAHPEHVRLSLHQLGPGVDVVKNQPPTIEQATVNGQPALWTSGPYTLEVQPSTASEHFFAARRLLTGHTLVWAVGQITYRLETGQPLDTAVRIAESLQ